MTQPNNYPSPSAQDFTEGGGSLYDECWVKITAARTEMNTQYRSDNKPTPMIILDVQEVESGETHVEMFPLGSSDNWYTDGKWVLPTQSYTAQLKGKPAQLSKVNRGVEMLANLQASGFKWDDATFPQTGVTQLINHFVWVHRFEIKDKKGNPIPVKKNGQDTGFNKTTITFTKWGGNGQQPIEQGAAQATTTQAPAGNDPADSAALETWISGKIATEPVPVQQILGALASEQAAKVAVFAPMISGAWMSDAARPWTVANGTVTKK